MRRTLALLSTALLIPPLVLAAPATAAPPDYALALDPPATITTGAAALPFTGTSSNNTATAIPNARYDIDITGTADFAASDIVLQYEQTPGSGTYLVAPLSGSTAAGAHITGSFGPQAGFPFPANTTLTTHFRIALDKAAPAGTLTSTVSLVNVDPNAPNTVLQTLATDTDTITAVNPPADGTAPTFTAASPPPTGQVNVAYGPYTFKASGVDAPTYTVTKGVLPAGLTLDATTGVLSGTPTVPTVATLTITASNGVQPDATADVNIRIDTKFPDVSGSSPFAAEISALIQQGVTQGYPDGYFKPLRDVTRQAFAAFLSRVLNLTDGPTPCAPGTSSFPDVSDDLIFCKAIGLLAENNIINGYDDGSYRPADIISRQAIAAMLYRAISWVQNGRDASKVQASSPCTTAPDFSDVTADNKFCSAIKFLADNEIARGYPDGSFGVTKPTTRQASAAFVYRFEKLLGLL